MAYTAPRFSGASSPSAYPVRYGEFRGVDFASDPTNVSRSRSPMAPNLISDASGYPEKRTGWRILRSYTYEICGIHRCLLGGTEYILVHCWNGLKNLIYKDGSTPTLLYTSVVDDATKTKSQSFVASGKLWILTGAEYLYFDGTTCALVSSIAHVPLIAIGCTPATGSGTTFESVNLLTGSKKKSFLADGAATEYYLDTDGIDAVTNITISGEEVSPDDYMVNAGAGKVIFDTEPPSPVVTGQDTVIITYTKTISGYADKINKCRICGLFGIGGANSDRVFFSGNPDSPNVDWHCEISYPAYSVDPSYVPDDSFAFIGSDENAIMGYRRIGQYQAIVKAQNDQDATVFLRTGSLDDDNKAIFGLQQGSAGVGAISTHSFANLGDSPLFLSTEGIHAIASTAVENVMSIQNRSFYVNRLLTNEANLQNAVAVEWKGYYVLCVNNRCYVLDRQNNRSYNAKSGSSFNFECYYWTNIPANVFCEVDGVLYFGTIDGKLCRFNTDITDDTQFNDNGAAIEAFWSTKVDDDGYINRYKGIASGRKGCAIMCKPSTNSTVKVYVATEENAIMLVNTYVPEGFDFSEVDFEDFAFDTGDVVEVFSLGKKVNKYIVLQIIAKNDVVNESFGVCGIMKSYVLKQYVR